MGDIEKRIERLEESFGSDAELKEKAERAGNKFILMEYEGGSAGSELFRDWVKKEAEALIAKHGSLELAKQAYADADLRDIGKALSKEEREELDKRIDKIRRGETP